MLDDGRSQDIGNFFSALSAGLLSGDRYNWIGPGFTQSIQNSNRQMAGQTSRSALKALLIQAGATPEQAEQYSANEKVASLALESLKDAKYDSIARGALGGGASNLGMGGSPQMSPAAPPGPGAGASLNGNGLTPPTGDSAAIQTKFVDTLKAGGLTNPFGLGAVAAYAQHESQYSPGNVNRSWSDPSERGAAGTSGGLLSWRNERLDKMRAATAGAQDPVAAQAQYMLAENPELTAKLQNAKSAEEANALMAQAWQFAGYNRQGGEYANRLATTQSYANRFGQTRTADASGAIPQTMPPGASGLNPGQKVDVAENEQDVQRLEGRLNQYPPNVYGITKPAQAPQAVADASSANPRADMPLPGSQAVSTRPDGIVIPPGSQSNRTQQALVINERNNLQRQIAENEAKIAALSPGGDKYKGIVTVLNGRNEVMQRRLDALDKVPDGFERDPDNPGRLRPVAGGPQSEDYLRSRSAATAKENTRVTEEVNQRREAIIAQGKNPDDPRNSDFILTGKMPREDQQPLSATDKKAIMEADEAVLSARSAIDNMKQAKELSKKAYAGPGASKLGYAGSFVGVPGSQETLDLENLITTNALTQLKSIFGGNPTEGERKILLDIQGSTGLPDASRQKIFDRAIAMAERRAKFSQDRSDELRGGTYYKSGGGGQQPTATKPATEQAPAAQPLQATQAPPPAAPSEGTTATNPKTGERLILRNGKWTPLAPQGGLL